MSRVSGHNRRGDATREQIAHYIKQFTRDQGEPPTVREIADALDLSTTSVDYNLDKMEAQGRVIRRGPRTIRGYSIEVNW